MISNDILSTVQSELLRLMMCLKIVLKTDPFCLQALDMTRVIGFTVQ